MRILLKRPVTATMAILGTTAMVLPAWPALLCDPPFPLPSSMEVGHRWTYSGVHYYQGDTGEGITRTESDSVHSALVVGRLQLAGWTYFELADGGFYRTDAAGRTWRYDAGTGTEELHWDIMGPPVGDALRSKEPSHRYVYYGGDSIPGESYVDHGSIWIAGWELSGDFFTFRRHGPFARHEWQSLPWLREPWVESSLSIILQNMLLDERITEIYRFEFADTASFQVAIVASDFGVLYCGESWGWPSDGAGHSYVLESFEQIDSITVVQDISFGQLKARTPASASSEERSHRGSQH